MKRLAFSLVACFGLLVLGACESDQDTTEATTQASPGALSANECASSCDSAAKADCATSCDSAAKAECPVSAKSE